MIQAKVEEASKTHHSHLTGLQKCVTKLLFLPGIPRAYKVTEAREDARLGNTKEDPENDHLLPRIDESSTLLTQLDSRIQTETMTHHSNNPKRYRNE